MKIIILLIYEQKENAKKLPYSIMSREAFFGSIIYGTDESELILQPHFHFRY